jgi:hypothetical protein
MTGSSIRPQSPARSGSPCVRGTPRPPRAPAPPSCWPGTPSARWSWPDRSGPPELRALEGAGRARLAGLRVVLGVLGLREVWLREDGVAHAGAHIRDPGCERVRVRHTALVAGVPKLVLVEPQTARLARLAR